MPSTTTRSRDRTTERERDRRGGSRSRERRRAARAQGWSDERRLRRERHQRALKLKRALIALVVAIAIVRLVTLGGSGGTPGSGGAEKPQRPSLARGGTSVLPEYRIVAFDGAPGAPSLGPIGRASPERAARRLLAQSRAYERVSKRPIYPAFHLIAAVAQTAPGADGLYAQRLSFRTIGRYLDVARRHKLYLLLDIQPGLSNMPDEVARLKRWLRDPNVGIALDPEWEIDPGQLPGQVIGHTSASEVNQVSRLMARITKRLDLPDKVLVVHQFTRGMIRNRSGVETRAGVDLVFTADGVGSPELKQAKYDELAPAPASGIDAGFKLFYEEDPNLMGPSQVLALRPRPSFVLYE